MQRPNRVKCDHLNDCVREGEVSVGKRDFSLVNPPRPRVFPPFSSGREGANTQAESRDAPEEEEEGRVGEKGKSVPHLWVFTHRGQASAEFSLFLSRSHL